MTSHSAAYSSSRPALLLLDRDGVILGHKAPYILCAEDVAFVPGSAEAIAEVARLGISIAIVTNQSPVGRGLITAAFVEDTHAWIRESLALPDAQIGFYYCPHVPDAGCECRKPKPGMLARAIRDFAVTAEECWMVGDHDTDMQAATAARVGRAIHVLSGRQATPSSHASDVFADLKTFVAASFSTTPVTGGQ